MRYRLVGDAAAVRVRKGNDVMTGGEVGVGQRYRLVRSSGGPPLTVWVVVKVYVPWQNGIKHGCLKSVDGSGGTMTLATSVIADKKRFVRDLSRENSPPMISPVRASSS
jgi:hypothetical protein